MSRPSFAIVTAAFLRRAWLEWTSELLPSAVQLASFSLGLLSQAFLGRLVDAAPNSKLGAYAGHYATFLILGMALLDLQNAVVSGLARRIREAQLTGSLEGLLATPASTPLMLLGLALPDVLLSFLRMALYALAGWQWFGLRVDQVNPLGVLVVLAFALVAFSSLALLGAALTMTLRRSDPLNVFLAATAAIAGGVLYPRSILPRALEWAGDALPIAPALDALRAATMRGAGPTDPGMTAPLAHLALLAALLAPLGGWLFARSLLRARIDGSLTAQ
jgi:ABC-2 type transport system permease protein